MHTYSTYVRTYLHTCMYCCCYHTYQVSLTPPPPHMYAHIRTYTYVHMQNDMTSTSIATLDPNVESLEKRESSPELLSPGGSPDRGPLSYSLLEPWELVQLMEDEVESFILLDCQPTLAYNSRHIMGAFGINLNPMIAKRLTAGVCVCTRVCVCVCVCVHVCVYVCTVLFVENRPVYGH